LAEGLAHVACPSQTAVNMNVAEQQQEETWTFRLSTVTGQEMELSGFRPTDHFYALRRRVEEAFEVPRVQLVHGTRPLGTANLLPLRTLRELDLMDGSHLTCIAVNRQLVTGGPPKTIASPGEDNEKFDAALEKSDIEAFVGLLSSTEAIAEFEENLHPWAENPRTVGALSLTQLTIMMQNQGLEKAKVGTAGAIPPVVDFLYSKQKDLQQSAILALGVLLQDCSDNVAVAVDYGAIEGLLLHKDSQISAERELVADTLRNIFVEEDQYREEFVDKGGISFYVKQLNDAAGASDDPDCQTSAVVNLLDLLEDNDGQIISRYVDVVKKAGVEAKLQSMLQAADDDDLKDSINDLLAATGTCDLQAPVGHNAGKPK